MLSLLVLSSLFSIVLFLSSNTFILSSNFLNSSSKVKLFSLTFSFNVVISPSFLLTRSDKPVLLLSKLSIASLFAFIFSELIPADLFKNSTAALLLVVSFSTSSRVCFKSLKLTSSKLLTLSIVLLANSVAFYYFLPYYLLCY